MNQSTKKILVLARDKKLEALRMAAGLTLLDDQVEVVVIGALPAGEEAELQLESLAFAEVPVDYAAPDSEANLRGLAERLTAADAVFIV